MWGRVGPCGVCVVVDILQEDREDKTTEERRETILFQCDGAWPFFFVNGVHFLVNPVCARDLCLLNSVKYDSSLISFSASWQVNSFSFLRIIYSLQLQFSIIF